VKFFFPDSQDQVDPTFDFNAEQSAEYRVRQRDDRYAHEVLHRPAYDGLLVSKPIIDGLDSASGKYTAAQRQRLYRLGVRRFFRLDQPGWSITTMGDCGGFTYVREEEPPYSVDEVIDFYEDCDFDQGISVDHVILGYDPAEATDLLPQWVRRQQLTLDLAADFLRAHAERSCRFIPLGVAQGWSPSSYAHAVKQLQRVGYRYIALGGMVPLKTFQILDCLRAVDDVRTKDVRIHLLGISRCDRVAEFADLGVASFDSTSPFRQAFKDDKDNYYTPERNYVAIRVPQVEGNVQVKAAITAGRIDQTRARELEQLCLQRLLEFDRGDATVAAVLDALAAYGELLDMVRDMHQSRPRAAPMRRGGRMLTRTPAMPAGATQPSNYFQKKLPSYRDLLEAAPWRRCQCGVCQDVGIQVAIFRGTERNKRRGFHNVYVFSASLPENAINEINSAVVP